MAARKFRLVNKGTRKAGASAGGTGSNVQGIDGPGEENGEQQSPISGTPSTNANTESTDTGTRSEKTDVQAGNAVDPATVQPRRGRGRPKGSKTATGPKVVESGTTPINRKKAIDPVTFEKVLVGIHAGIAALVNTPEFAIDMDDAAILRENFQALAKAHGWGLGAVSPKTEATINAAIAAGIIYYPRFKAARLRARQEKLKVMPRVQATPPKVAPQPPPKPPAPNPHVPPPPVIVNGRMPDAIDEFLANGAE